MKSEQDTQLSKAELNHLWEIKDNNFFEHRLSVLTHVVKADTNKRFLRHIPNLNPRRYNRPGLLPSNPNLGLQPDLLIKLKRKAEFSLHQDFANMGKVQVADIIINSNKNK